MGHRSDSRRTPLLGAAAALAVLAAVAGGDVARADPRNAPRPRDTSALVGGQAPEITVTRLAGHSPVRLRELRGRVVVLDFWATWCRPCVQLMGVLDALSQRHRDHGLTVVGISSEPPQALAPISRRPPVGYTLAWDDGQTMRRYAVDAIPTLVLVDREGKVRRVVLGAPSADGLERELVGLLSETAATP